MYAVTALLAALGFNYHQHRHGRPTVCSTSRRFIPAAVFLIGWGGLTAWICPHYCHGFRPIDLLTKE